MKTAPIQAIKTLGQLKAANYQPISIKDELRKNLIAKLQKGNKLFDGILGYEETVIPDLERAILSRHNINLLGLRGQAKTRMARLMVHLLDEYIPIVAGSELNEDPLNPITNATKDFIAQHGDDTPIEWLHCTDRYAEKLATPDVTVADLIGDVDPIKASNLKLSYADERVIHFGMIPRSNRCIYVINELPDLQPRIQVALFNILQEGDVQIRGFKLRLPLDMQFVFTANPEDYTNRGSIITPLKDRIESQILTHYPKTVEIAKQITQQEANLPDSQRDTIVVPELVKDLLEQISFEARESEFVDSKSGVSARLTISAYENLMSAAERRMLINNEKNTTLRITDFIGVIPAITGKVELVYEGEQEGPQNVAFHLLSQAIRTLFIKYFPNPGKLKKKADNNPYAAVADWFSNQGVDLLVSDADKDFVKEIQSVQGLEALVKQHVKQLNPTEMLLFMEFALYGMAEYSLLSKRQLTTGVQFKDLLSSMVNFDDDTDDQTTGSYGLN